MADFHPLLLLTIVRARAAVWRMNGASRLSACINGAALLLAWIILPLEHPSWQGLLRSFHRYYPQLQPGHPQPLDCLRIFIQTIFLAFVKVPVQLRGVVKFCKEALDACSGALDRLGNWLLNKGLTAAARWRLEERSGATTPAMKRLSTVCVWVLGLLALALAVLCITQPFSIEGQVLFLCVVLILAVILTRVKARLALFLLFVISIVVSGRYLWWRCTSTVNTDDFWGLALGIVLLAAEIYAFLVMVLGYFQVAWVLDRQPAPMPSDRSAWPHVDIFIPTYNEDLSVVKPTLYAALNLDWPAEKLHVYILDDGSRKEFSDFAAKVGAGYIKRDEHHHAKAGNINHALTVTSSPFITIFDCDHVPSSDFLTKTMGWFLKNPKIALVQTPHHFYSQDPFEKNLHLPAAMPPEGSLFHDFIQKGNDCWNATMFCGSNAVMRREALNQVGGIAVETVTEDAHTSLKLNSLGWSSAFLDVPVAAGLATETLAAHIGQRIRWARGMIQIFRLDNPLFKRGLTLPQRLCFFNAMIHFLHGAPRIIFLLAPLPYMFANIYIIYATAAAIFAYVIPHMVHSAITTQMLQKGHRYPFLSGVYETVLSWYILLPTTVALIFPHKGKFNVTAKGGTINRRYLDWHITKPFLILLGLNFAGLLVGIWKAFFEVRPEYLTLVINIGWIVYNLLILGASMAVAVEEQQTHKFPRVHLEVPGRLTIDGKTYNVELNEYSQTDARVRASGEGLDELVPGAHVTLELFLKDVPHAFTGVVQDRDTRGFAEIRLDLPTPEVERDYNRCTFSREGMWQILAAKNGLLDARFTTGFIKLVGFAAYGYRSMIEFLPPQLKFLRDFVSWCASMLPRVPLKPLSR